MSQPESMLMHFLRCGEVSVDSSHTKARQVKVQLEQVPPQAQDNFLQLVSPVVHWTEITKSPCSFTGDFVHLIKCAFHLWKHMTPEIESRPGETLRKRPLAFPVQAS